MLIIVPQNMVGLKKAKGVLQSAGIILAGAFSLLPVNAGIIVPSDPTATLPRTYLSCCLLGSLISTGNHANGPSADRILSSTALSSSFPPPS